jgi:hypothetical protein
MPTKKVDPRPHRGNNGIDPPFGKINDEDQFQRKSIRHLVESMMELYK